MAFDLTIDRKFNKNKQAKQKIAEFWFRRYFFKGAFISRRIPPTSPPTKTHTLLETGTKKQRKVQKAEKEFSTPKGGCDCCGRIERIPWKKDFGLCGRCSKRLNRKVGVPWNISSNV